jgi:trk system potassium uptake protein TrkA
VSELKFPEDTSFASIVRDGHVISPNPQELLMGGDELLFVATSAAEDKLKSVLLGN